MKSSARWLFLALLTLLFVSTASAHYCPRTGRFISRDPLGEAGGFNLYAYCGNDPVNRHDPLGLATLDGHHQAANTARQNLKDTFNYDGMTTRGPLEPVESNRDEIERYLNRDTIGFFIRKEARNFDLYRSWYEALKANETRAVQMRSVLQWAHSAGLVGKNYAKTIDWDSDHFAALAHAYRENGGKDFLMFGANVALFAVDMAAGGPSGEGLVAKEGLNRLAYSGVREGVEEHIAAAVARRGVSANSTVGRILGKLDQYPQIIDLRTGRSIPMPSDIGEIVSKAQRVSWGARERGEFISEWYRRGYKTPRGGWEYYDIHHIKPREFGGTNDFWNLAPVERQMHQNSFSNFWREFTGL
jgi:hypothetical protein